MCVDYSYVAYFDEAGDTGLTRVLPIDENGSSEWFVVAAHLIRKENESDVVNWVKSIRKDIHAIQGPALHYRDLSQKKRLRTCELLAGHPAKVFAVCSNKRNMRGYSNERAATRGGKQWFYNYCVRIVLERLTEFCFHDATKRNQSCKIKMVFSERNGHQLAETIAYLELLRIQSSSGSTLLDKWEVKHQTLKFGLMSYVPHTNNAGLQLADIAASSFYQSVNTLGSKFSLEPAKLLGPVMAKKSNLVADYGLIVHPPYGLDKQLNYQQKEIFRHYGYYLP